MSTNANKKKSSLEGAIDVYYIKDFIAANLYDRGFI